MRVRRFCYSVVTGCFVGFYVGLSLIDWLAGK
jgi:hypothetical protein